MCRVNPTPAMQSNFFGSGRTYDEMTSGRLSAEENKAALSRIPERQRFMASFVRMLAAANRSTAKIGSPGRIPKKTPNA